MTYSQAPFIMFTDVRKAETFHIIIVRRRLPRTQDIRLDSPFAGDM